MTDDFAESSEPAGSALHVPDNRLPTGARRNWAVALWATQVLATVAAVTAGGAEIESILVTGPALTIAGLALALIARPLCSWSVLGYSLSGPLVAALCAVLIAALRWGPEEAADPILLILFLYAFVAIPAALIVFPQLFHWSIAPQSWPPFPWQFSLKSLLLVTTALCVVVPALRFLFGVSTHGDYIIFSLFVVVTMGLVGLSLFLFVAGRRTE